MSVSNGQVEMIAVQISSIDMIIINCYRQPQCSTQNYTAAMNSIKELLEDLPRPDIIMCGDYNFPHIKSPDGTVHGGTLEDQSQARAPIELSERLFLTQQIT